MGKRGNGELKYYAPDVFDSRHIQVAKLCAAGMKNSEIAEMMGYTEARVSVIRNDPRAQEIIRETRRHITDKIDDVALRLEQLSGEALDKVVDIMRYSADENAAQRSAFSILYRAGYGKIDKRIEAHGAISPEAAEKLFLASESARNIVDADYTIESD
jgi:transcriptional regulator